MEPFIYGLGPARSLDIYQIIASFATSLALCSIITLAYRKTHVGVSYSRSFVQSLVLSGIVSCIMIIAVGNNLARGLGILGALAIIRFRTPIRNPRDIIFLFASLAIGISAGSQLYLVAIAGTLTFALTALVLDWSPYSTKQTFEGLLRFSSPMKSKQESDISSVLSQFSSNVELIAMRDSSQGERVEYAYQIRLLHPSLKSELIRALNDIGDIDDINFVMQRETVEI